jgi:antitoxin HigA-1
MARPPTSTLWTIIEGGVVVPMKDPPHPGELIGDSLDELGVTIVDAAKALGVSRQQLHNLIAGRSAITPEMAVKLEKALGSTADTWLRMQMSHDLAQVRKREGELNVRRLAPA